MKKWKNEETNNGALFRYRTSQLSVHSANIVIGGMIASIFNSCVSHTRRKFKILQKRKKKLDFLQFSMPLPWCESHTHYSLKMNVGIIIYLVNFAAS